MSRVREFFDRDFLLACLFGLLLAIAGHTVTDWRYWLLASAYCIGVVWKKP